ncbi:MAG: hypothetical protein P4L46_00430 [Fimbriimonas sp.]|nr:hypothetical protein [Fimbriimonas sp.]
MQALNLAIGTLLGYWYGADVNSVAVSHSGMQIAIGTGNGLVEVAANPFYSTVPVSGLTVNPTTVLGGAVAIGNVTLSKSAPVGGNTVLLTSSDASAIVPALVTVPAGASSATFAIHAQDVASYTTVVLTASAAGQVATTVLNVTPLPIRSFGVSPTSVIGGASSVGTVTLKQPASSGGISIHLASDNPAATVPASVEVANGTSSATFTVATSSVDARAVVAITAGNGSGAKSASLTVQQAPLASVSLNPASVGGGANATGTVRLDGTAGPGGDTVALASSSKAARIPASVNLLAGQSTGTFSITTIGVTMNTGVRITATLDGSSQMATLTITPAALALVSVNPTAITGGNSSLGTVDLTGNASASGLVVTLSSTNSAAKVPRSVSVAANQGSATFAVTTSSVTKQQVVTITAKCGAVTKTATLTVNPPPPPTLVSIGVSPGSVQGGSTSSGLVTLSGLAPAGGEKVSLTSNSKSATLPVSVTIASGKSSVGFTVKTIAVATQSVATLTAKLGTTSKSATLTIAPPSIKSLSVSPSSVKGGKSSVGTINLTGPAPSGGIAVSISSDSGSATVPSTVTISSGKSSGTLTIKTKAVTRSTSATIKATFGGASKTAQLTLT